MNFLQILRLIAWIIHALLQATANGNLPPPPADDTTKPQ